LGEVVAKAGLSRLGWWTRLTLAVFVILAMIAATVAVWAFDLAAQLQAERIVTWIQDQGTAGALALMGGVVLAVVIGPIPTVPFTVALGVSQGWLVGSVLAIVGAMTGALAAFVIARFIARDTVAEWLGGRAVLCRSCSDRLLFGIVLVARLIPVVSFALISYAAGLTAMSLRAYLLATFLGMLPMTVVYTVVGASIRVDVVWAGLGGLVVTGLLALTPRIVERWNPFGLRDRLMRDHAPDEGLGRQRENTSPR